MPSRKIASHWYLALALLLAIGVGFRFYNLDKKVFWADETRSALRVAGFSTPEMLDELPRRELWAPEELQKFQRLNDGHGVMATLRSLATDDPKHPPLFYVLLRVWCGAFGDSVFAMRFLAALISLLIFPALWWLCRELFFEDENQQPITLVALALLALSPFHILYAQEAREYSIWTVAIFVSCALLLRALRLGERKWWIAYGFSLALGMYAHTLHITLWLVHATFVLALHRRQFVPFFCASLLAGVLFLPWALIIVQRQAELVENTMWLAFDGGKLFLVKAWVFIFSSLFLDASHSQLWPAESGAAMALNWFSRLMRLVVFGVIAFSIWTLRRRASQQNTLLILLLIGVPFLILVLPDLLFGGVRSAIGRFMLPTYLGIHLAVAILIAGKLNTPARKPWAGVLGLLLLTGFISCSLSSQAEAWWNKAGSYSVPRVARTVNAAKDPLVVTNSNQNFLALNRRLEPHVRLHLAEENGPQNFDVRRFTAAQNFGAIFFYAPPEALHKNLQRQGFALEKADADDVLWRLQKL